MHVWGTMRTNIYVDGFNLYFGAVKHTRYKWLDLAAMCAKLIPGIRINRIRYFTARVVESPTDTEAPVRQEVYLRALRTIPNLSIHLGHFVRWPKLMPQFPLAFPNGSTTPQAVQIQKTEEKGSDVNLGVYLVRDCFIGDCDQAVVVSNDSDLAEAVHIVVRDCGKPVVVVNPHPRARLSRQLCEVSTSCVREINTSVLAASQFPAAMTDADGVITKPERW